jgi:hypothetical protein
MRRDRAWLLQSARSVAVGLRSATEGTSLRIRVPSRATKTITDGWRAVIGDLGKGGPRLEIWFDRFSGHADRKLCASVVSHVRRPIRDLAKRVSEQFWTVRKLTLDDISDGTHSVLVDPLKRSEFRSPVIEEYSDGETFFSLYDFTRSNGTQFHDRAIAFFTDVSAAMPNSGSDESRDVFPQFENRKVVAVHLRRERSRLLATECKIRDDYRCRLCGFKFEDDYGELGIGFAEAHHMVPLHQLRENIKTNLGDLRTVCSNCHRMLHRMSGQASDWAKLRRIVRGHRRHD